MYSDPAKIRDNTLKLRLNKDELALLDKVCKKVGGERASVARDLILKSIVSIFEQQEPTPPTKSENLARL